MTTACPEQMAAACRACALFEEGHPVVGVPRIGATIMALVGTPSYYDVVLQQPLTAQSAAGRFVREAMKEAGLSRSQVHLTTVLRHRPPDARAPQASEIAACMPILTTEIDQLRPRVIVAMGEVAAHALGREQPLRHLVALHGLSYRASFGEIPVVCTHHPGGRGASPALSLHLADALRQAARLAGEAS